MTDKAREAKTVTVNKEKLIKLCKQLISQRRNLDSVLVSPHMSDLMKFGLDSNADEAAHYLDLMGMQYA